MQTPRHLADQFEFAFLADQAGVRLFQGGSQVCHGKQPDGLTFILWQEGRSATWDVTLTDTVAASYVAMSSSAPHLLPWPQRNGKKTSTQTYTDFTCFPIGQ